MIIAVLLAAGVGHRMGNELPKQFIEVASRTILEHSVRAFSAHEGVDEIVVVSHPDFIGRVQDITAPYPKVRHIVPGGKERYDSSIAAIRLYEDRPDACLMIHDAARPLVSQRIIGDCIAALSRYDAVDVAIPTTDTIIRVDDEGRIASIPPRASLRNVQTPQCFRLPVIADAYRRGLADPAFVTTDDCGVVHRYRPDVPIYVVEGESTNIKITYPSDLALAEKVLGK
mgnify:CR=1 FL=1